MAQRFVGQAFGAGREVEGLERNPARVSAAPQHVEDRLEIVVARAAVPAVQFVDVDVADEVEVAVHQRGVRLRFVDGVVHVEHGADGGAVDLAHDADGFVERQDHVALVDGQRLDQHRDAAALRPAARPPARPSM